MLETATVSSFFTKVQELVSVENLVGKHLLQVPDLIKDFFVDASLLVRSLWGVADMTINSEKNS